ncbi:MAG: hypothetical protein E5299_00974 [Burkholderia gladioli]|nr:MAG: hypothetical protein E5299_00974 [Burkholderia gladioli]
MASTGIISGDTNGLQRSEVRHAVDYTDANGDLGPVRIDVTRLETVAGERLKPIKRIFGKRSPVVATVFFPFSTTVTGNCINRAITPRRTGHIRWLMNGTLAWPNRRNSTCVQQWPHGMAWCRRHHHRR